MCADTVADIRLNEKDPMGDPIEVIYSKSSNIYAVYGTPKRVKIQFADDDALMLEQRRALSPLNPLRGQIDGLLDTWRANAKAGNARTAKVSVFDRRTADALTVALQGDQAHAETLLEGVMDDILQEQESIGRAAYLAIATVCAVAVFVAFMLISLARPAAPVPNAAGSLLDGISTYFARTSTFIALNKISLAAGFGALGALFSIAIGIRKRAIRPDMQQRDNVIDAILRIMIGVVSAVILFSLLKSQLVSLSFGASPAQFGSGGPSEMHVAIIVAFVAGFAEMLVGDYLTKAVLEDRKGDDAVAAAQQAAARETEANELNPRGRKEVEAKTPDTAASAAANLVSAPEIVLPGLDHEAGTDGCMCNIALGEDEHTSDVELPPATGGIDKAA